MGAMAGKVCIVTGSNTGIGKETARGLASLGATVVMGCRDSDKSRAARDDLSSSTGRNDVTLIPLDLASKAAIRDFAAEFRKRFDRLDVLVNNAGVSQTRRTTTTDGFEGDFGVNHLGTFLLTHELLELLERSAPSRVVVVSSRLHARGTMAWDDLQFERRAYNGFARTTSPSSPTCSTRGRWRGGSARRGSRSTRSTQALSPPSSSATCRGCFSGSFGSSR